MPSSLYYSSAGVALPTIMAQSRTAVVVNDTPKYRVLNSVTQAGTLPDRSVFLIEIVDSRNPDLDTLARVASPADFITFPTSRISAVSASQSYFRSLTWTQDYTDIDNAKAGAILFRDRLDALVGEWFTFVQQFKFDAPGENFFFPRGDSELSDRISRYLNAVSSTATALTAKNTADASLTSAQNAFNTAQSLFTLIALATVETNKLRNQKTSYDSVLSTIATQNTNIGVKPASFPTTIGATYGLWNNINTLIATIDGSVGVPAGITAARNNFVVGASDGVANFTAITNAFTSAFTAAKAVQATVDNAAIDAVYTYAQTSQSTAQTALSLAKTAQIAAQAAYDQSISDEDIALNNVLAVCPDFDKNNPTASLPS